MKAVRLAATVPHDLWAKLVLRIQASDDPGLVALVDQIVSQTGVLTIEETPVIPASAAIPWSPT